MASKKSEMRKIVMIMMCCMIGISAARAQTFAEWFRQKKTQRQYLIEQILALKVYGEYLQKGYGIARDGLSTVRNITDGEFRLHDLFFTSLRNVNPAIKKYGRIADIIDLQLRTVQTAQRQIGALKKSPVSRADQIAYVSEVYAKLLADCADVLEQLAMVITSGKMELRDDERLERIDTLYALSLDQYTFAESFGEEVLQLERYRIRQLDQIEGTRKLYNSTP